jgi:hypothetical protein
VKLIGVGLGRTGTMSLKVALQDLGVAPTLHMIDLIVGEHKDRDLERWKRVADSGGQLDWEEVFDGYEATVDWPACSCWREIVQAFPEAHVLLNVRDFESWYTSCENTLLALWGPLLFEGKPPPTDADRPPPSPILMEIVEKIIWERDFKDRYPDRNLVREFYDRRVEDIKAAVPAARLTVWKLGDGWAPLAKMLDVPVPDHDFPHLHDTDQFRMLVGLPPLERATNAASAETP